jgi:hypothetical protein
MAQHVERLTASVLLGVGAAFDFHAGLKRQAPRWMQRSGLEWLFRLATEPRRLWRRYLINNPLFVWLTFLQIWRPTSLAVADGQRDRVEPSAALSTEKSAKKISQSSPAPVVVHGESDAC